MILNEKDIATLEAYYNHELSATDISQLKKRIAQDASFKKAVQKWEELWVLAFTPTQEEQQMAIKHKAYLKTVEAQIKAQQSKTPTLVQPYVWKSLLALLVLALLFIVWKTKSDHAPATPTTNNNQVIAQATDIPYFMHLDRDDLNLSTSKTKALAYYDQKNYQQAWPLLQQNLEGPQDSIQLLYAAVAAIASEQPRVAIQALKALDASDTFVYYNNEIHYYLALAYIQTQEKNKADSLLHLLLEGSNNYSNNAKKLLEINN